VAGYEAILRIKVIADATQAAAGLDKAEAAGGKFGSVMRKAALPAAAAGAAVLAFAKKAGDAASDLQQSQGAVEAVFGSSSKAVEKNAAAAAKTMGLSASQYNNYASLVGTAMQNAGMSVEDSVKASNDIMQRGADLSALYGGTTADAVDAINAAVSRSEFDPLEKYGVSLNMTAVNAELAAKGQDKLTGAALATAKKQIVLEQVFKQSSKAAGQYAREADSAAGSQQTATAEWENASAALGQILLPLMSKLATTLGEVAKWAAKNTTTVQILAGVVLGLSVAVLAVNAGLKVFAATQAVVNGVMAIGNGLALGTRIGLAALAVQEFAVSAASKAAAAAQWALNAAQAAMPIAAVILLVIALVAAIVLLWKKSQTFRTIVTGVWNGVKIAAAAAVNAIRAVWSVLWSVLTGYVRVYLAVFRAAFNAIRAVSSAVAAGVKGAWNAVAALVAAVAARIRGPLVAAFNAAKSAAHGVGDALSAPFNAVKSAIEAVIGAVRSLIGWLSRIKVPKISLPKIPGVSGVTVAATPTARGLSANPAALGRTVTSAGGGVTINITGAIDPESTARQVRRLLLGFDVRHSTPQSGRGLRTV
jgi:hypothetical protein